MSIAQFLCEPVEPVAVDTAPVWEAPDDGDPYYLPAAELVEPYRVPGWARG